MSLIPQLLNEIWQPFNTVSTNNNMNAPVDWKETPEAHVIKADLPGLKKEQVKVELENDGKILSISGERPKEKEEEGKDEKWHRLERPRGEFRRRFYLPSNAKTEAINASMENGVLTVKIPKKEIKKPEIKTIEIATN